MSSTNLSTGSAFTDCSARGPTRNFNVRGSADLAVAFETANAANASAGGRVKDPAVPQRDLVLRGPAAHSQAVLDAAPYVRAVVLQGTVTAAWMDDAPMPDAGPQGPAGTAYVTTAVQEDDYTAAAGKLVLCDPTTKAFTVTLPAASAAGDGAHIAVKNVTTVTSHAITVGRTGSDTIDGGTSATLNTSKASAVFVSDGVSAWHKL